MAGGEATLIRRGSTTARTAAQPTSPRFLLPRASGNRVLPDLPPLPPRDLVLDGGIRAEFEGWGDSTDLWRHWVAKLRPLHEQLWRELGILEGILATTYQVRRGGEAALLQLLPFWCPLTNTFVFPWGEANVTLEDVAALAGLPILGFPVREPGYSNMVEMTDELALAAVRGAIVLTDRREAGTTAGWAWAEHFMLRQYQHHQHQHEQQQRRREHAAFLSMWLARLVLPAGPSDPYSGSDHIPPGEDVLPIAISLAHGHTAALASIYSGLSELRRHFINSGRTSVPSVSAPMHVLQLWVWERFPELRPATGSGGVPDPAADGEDDVPRAARWHDAYRAVDPGHARAVFTAPKEFLWRPYGSSFWLRRGGASRALLRLSFARCLQPCELVGVDDVEQYNPHRVARQLGFDQDVPGTVTRLNTNLWQTAWQTYTTDAEDYAFAIRSDEPGVTDAYAQLWKPYSSSSLASAAAAAAVEERDAMILDGSGNGDTTSLLASSDREMDSLMEETSNDDKGPAGNNERSSSRNDSSGPKWAVEMEMIQRASANRQAQMAKSRVLIAKLAKEIQELNIYKHL